MDYQVVKVCKDSITGNITCVECGDGSHFKKATVIKMIDAQTDYFYTVDYTTNKKIAVFVSRVYPAPFIKTAADGKEQDNLGALPSCTRPYNCK